MIVLASIVLTLFAVATDPRPQADDPRWTHRMAVLDRLARRKRNAEARSAA